MNASQVVGEGDASLTLNKLKVQDEGTYICTVSIGPFHAQQVIQLHVRRKSPFHCIKSGDSTRRSTFQSLLCCFFFSEPPCVSLSEEKLIHKGQSPQTLSCHCAKYYPLDAQVSEYIFKSVPVFIVIAF